MEGCERVFLSGHRSRRKPYTDPMTTAGVNSLAQASSSYLRSAMHQPIRWHQWGEEAFQVAKRENKPILLDIGAVWCHWCHVMDRESYDDPEIANLVNEHFIAIKVDRDERPDVDHRHIAVEFQNRFQRIACLLRKQSFIRKWRDVEQQAAGLPAGGKESGSKSGKQGG